MQYSKYVHLFEVDDDVIALYHSLLIRTVFISSSESELITNYFESGIINDSNTSEIVKYLYTNYFIVDNNEDDESLYHKCVEMISEPAISNAYIVVTENCNFNCKYCFIANAVQGDKPIKVMSKETATKAVELLQRTYEQQQHSYDKTITFYGGEPLLNFDIIKHFIDEVNRIKQEKYWPSDVKYALITNGSLITKDILQSIKDYGIALSISYDVDKVSHSLRVDKSGKNSYDVVRQKINLCRKESIPFSLSITITDELLKNKDVLLPEIIKMSPLTIAFNLLIPNKETKQSDNYYEFATDFMIEAFSKLRGIGLYEDRIMRKVHSFKENKMHLYDCCAGGGNQYVIAPDGMIGICHGYLNNRKYFSGNVNDKDFDFRKNSDYKYWKERTPLLMQQCMGCECLSICGGGCPYAADYMYGSIYELDTRFCIHAKKVLKWLINDLYQHVKCSHE